MLLFGLLLPNLCFCSLYVKLSPRNAGVEFDGIGAVSGGGATSKLLYSISAEAREPILQALFAQPGGVQLLKVEIGGDDQSTEGAEASHMHTENEFNYESGYEWRLMQDGRRINPSLPICALPWAFPRWLDPTSAKNPFSSTNITAGYVIKWLEGAREHGIEIDCVGIWNERVWDVEYVKTLKITLNNKGFDKVRVVLADQWIEEVNFTKAFHPEITPYYDILGIHYPDYYLPKNVQLSGKTLWASEDYSTFERQVRPLNPFGCLAKTINRNYASANITATFIWHLVSAFYKDFPYYGAGLAMAEPPSYRTYKLVPAFTAMWQTTAYTRRLWRFLKQGSGSGLIAGDVGSYVSYTDGRNLTIVIETFSNKQSVCLYGNERPSATEKNRTIAFEFLDEFAWFSELNVVQGTATSKLMVVSGKATITVPPNVVLTLTTLPIVPFPQLVQSQPSCPSIYTDHFDQDYSNGDEPRWLTPQKGSWEVFDGMARQVVQEPPISWCAGDQNSPFALMNGNSIAIDVKIPEGGTVGVFVGLTSATCSGCKQSENCKGLFAAFYGNSTKGFVFNDIGSKKPIQQLSTGHLWRPDTWKTAKLSLTSNKLLIGFGHFSKIIELDTPTKYTYVAIGSLNFGHSYWDNLRVDRSDC